MRSAPLWTETTSVSPEASKTPGGHADRVVVGVPDQAAVLRDDDRGAEAGGESDLGAELAPGTAVEDAEVARVGVGDHQVGPAVAGSGRRSRPRRGRSRRRAGAPCSRNEPSGGLVEQDQLVVAAVDQHQVVEAVMVEIARRDRHEERGARHRDRPRPRSSRRGPGPA